MCIALYMSAIAIYVVDMCFAAGNNCLQDIWIANGQVNISANVVIGKYY